VAGRAVRGFRAGPGLGRPQASESALRPGRTCAAASGHPCAAAASALHYYSHRRGGPRHGRAGPSACHAPRSTWQAVTRPRAASTRSSGRVSGRCPAHGLADIRAWQGANQAGKARQGANQAGKARQGAKPVDSIWKVSRLAGSRESRAAQGSPVHPAGAHAEWKGRSGCGSPEITGSLCG
jgi:hypothetical protein